MGFYPACFTVGTHKIPMSFANDDYTSYTSVVGDDDNNVYVNICYSGTSSCTIRIGYDTDLFYLSEEVLEPTFEKVNSKLTELIESYINDVFTYGRLLNKSIFNK